MKICMFAPEFLPVWGGVCTYIVGLVSYISKKYAQAMYLLKTDVAKLLDLRSVGFITKVKVATQIVTEHSIITEVPIKYRPRIGKGKLKAWNGFGVLLFVKRLARKYNLVLLFSAISGLTAMPAKDY